jgi:hypothetical protein
MQPCCAVRGEHMLCCAAARQQQFKGSSGWTQVDACRQATPQAEHAWCPAVVPLLCGCCACASSSTPVTWPVTCHRHHTGSGCCCVAISPDAPFRLCPYRHPALSAVHVYLLAAGTTSRVTQRGRALCACQQALCKQQYSSTAAAAYAHALCKQQYSSSSLRASLLRAQRGCDVQRQSRLTLLAG